MRIPSHLYYELYISYKYCYSWDFVVSVNIYLNSINSMGYIWDICWLKDDNRYDSNYKRERYCFVVKFTLLIMCRSYAINLEIPFYINSHSIIVNPSAL